MSESSYQCKGVLTGIENEEVERCSFSLGHLGPCSFDYDVLETEPEPIGETIHHPSHYGGEDNPYEAIKVITAWNLGFALGNAVKYICRACKKGDFLEDLKKARWYLDYEIKQTEETLNEARKA